MRRPGLFLLAAVLAAGCGGSEKTQSPPAERQASSTRPPSAEPEPGPGTIVIRGRKEAGSSARQDEDRDWEKIAELEEQARASQGKPVAPRATTAKPPEPASEPEGDEKEQLDQEIAAVAKQITDLQAEKESLLEDKRVRRGSRRVMREVSTDPARTKEIEAKLTELESRKRELEQRREAVGR